MSFRLCGFFHEAFHSEQIGMERRIGIFQQFAFKLANSNLDIAGGHGGRGLGDVWAGPRAALIDTDKTRDDHRAVDPTNWRQRKDNILERDGDSLWQIDILVVLHA